MSTKSESQVNIPMSGTNSLPAESKTEVIDSTCTRIANEENNENLLEATFLSLVAVRNK